jgi:hypothetical protein
MFVYGTSNNMTSDIRATNKMSPTNFSWKEKRPLKEIMEEGLAAVDDNFHLRIRRESAASPRDPAFDD